MYLRFILIFSFLFAFYVSASANFDKQQAREESLLLLEQDRPTKSRVENLENSGKKEKAFIEYYLKEVEPITSQFGNLSRKYSMYRVMIDRALFNSKEEKKEWQKTMQGIYVQLYETFESDEYKLKVRKWYVLSKGLKGDLVEQAKEAFKEIEKESLPEEHRWIRTRLNELKIKISDISNNYPHSEELTKIRQAASNVEADFRAGLISLDEAIHKQKKLTEKVSSKHYGKYVANTAREHLKEAAILRTKLANIKGYKTWAEYILADDAKSYRAGYRTPKQRVKFLRGFLSQTRSAYKKYLEYLIETQTDKTLETFDSDGLHFLTLDDTSLVKDYFDKDKVEPIWRQTMRDSGFPQEVLSNVISDNYPRPGKYTHAYMMPAIGHKPHYVTINAATLSLSGPVEGSSDSWYPAKTFIVQNFEINSPDSYQTSFHEGGHGLDYNYREVISKNHANNSYTETHSMTMEHFLLDEEYVRETFKNKNGDSIPEETLQLYLKNKRINELVFARGNIYQALFDIAVWDYEYTEDSMDYVDHSLKLSDELAKKYMLRDRKKDNKELYEKGYYYFVTDHYYSGSVRYIGYVYANMAAEMSIAKIYDELELSTGRRSLYKQPSLANILIEGYYRKGFETQFPQNIEDFTGKEFKPQDLAIEYVQFIEELVKDKEEIIAAKCAQILSR